MTERVIEDPVLRQRYSFRAVTGDDGRESLHVDIHVDPGGGVTPHIHPAMEERFFVLEGSAELLAGRKWVEKRAGEDVLVPPGTRHAYRNRSDAVVHMRCEATPPTSLQAFLEDAAALSQAGKITRHAIPKGPRAALEAAAMAHRYSDDTVLLFPPLPPPPIQRLILPRLAKLAERLG